MAEHHISGGKWNIIMMNFVGDYLFHRRFLEMFDFEFSNPIIHERVFIISITSFLKEYSFFMTELQYRSLKAITKLQVRKKKEEHIIMTEKNMTFLLKTK